MTDEQIIKKQADELKTAKAEAVKEFAERVKKEINFPLAVWRVFDNILAEMTDPNITKVEHNSLCETETYRKGES